MIRIHGRRTSAMTAVYDQAIQLKATQRAETSTGQTTNLMSVDAELLGDEPSGLVSKRLNVDS